ncbi:hypothetical protein AB0M71_41050 [Amycolatopsis sp. NPDC051114]|uniref:hypothetical protein n=1 Tax=Amycolatopsis sp. NPDC051114 TaxID=3155280 RepID=UPI00341F611B
MARRTGGGRIASRPFEVDVRGELAADDRAGEHRGRGGAARLVAAITDWRPIAFTGPAIGGFTGSADLFGDGSVRAIQTGDEAQYVDSVRRIQWLRRAFLPRTPHPHRARPHRLRRPADRRARRGELSDVDLSWAESCEPATFGEPANLNPARLPRFVPAGDGGPVGRVA